MEKVKNISLSKKKNIKGADALAYFGELFSHLLTEEGVEEKRAYEIGLNIMEEIRRELGGQYVYFPMGMFVGKYEKRDEIYSGFLAGKSISELAQEYNYSIQGIYRIIAIVKDGIKKEREEELEEKRKKEKERWKREN
ncbi:hypothetical protein BV924_16435 [Pectobacterium odoriferum]|uniref:Mor transcription activator domain-containing protein n=1 Tax=Pectobacterium odoriferum TaxID=78398 RepID=A0ABD6VNK9_9GAMM|nr:Mor transcription activator family protein [Pectobacterium odoriferum]POE10749.1 hypothetical protein BV924_16435 [Pectobacterium odoriferum]POE25363.1 hypothetical protein BV926_16375 [Pectobacterium odoriferum]POE29727.1 hypothetical protein BV919_16395 [Pectobacterium odoriferum]POE38388.1 hypothetical protein BV920_16865 [Pectobacterium odoriferum]